MITQSFVWFARDPPELIGHFQTLCLVEMIQSDTVKYGRPCKVSSSGGSVHTLRRPSVGTFVSQYVTLLGNLMGFAGDFYHWIEIW